jgi:lipid II:glycine glycyltransferase (peptidoglycan interpeptide bridge formation enzyme)
MFSSYSMAIDLSLSEENLLAACHFKWRQNWRRAGKRNLTVREWTDATVDQIHSVYLSMQAVKGIEEQHSRDEIAGLLEHLRDHLVLYRCDDEDGELVSLSGSLVIGNRAGNWFAATNERGRKLRASYLTWWATVLHCKKLGVRYYDLAGIDPSQNPGGYQFKRGTGAAHLEYLGEWDWANHPFFRWFGNWAIARRASLTGAPKAVESSEPERTASVTKSVTHVARNLGLQESTN